MSNMNQGYSRQEGGNVMRQEFRSSGGDQQRVQYSRGGEQYARGGVAASGEYSYARQGGSRQEASAIGGGRAQETVTEYR